MSGWIWNEFNIVSFKNYFILLGLRDRTSNIGPYLKPVDVFFTQEISDFNQRPVFLNNDIDWDVSIHRPHLVTETQCTTLDHVLNVTADGSDQLLSVIPPFVNPGPLLFLSKETQLLIRKDWNPSAEFPMGFFILTVRPFTVISTFSGKSLVWLLGMVFFLTVDGAKPYYC